MYTSTVCIYYILYTAHILYTYHLLDAFTICIYCIHLLYTYIPSTSHSQHAYQCHYQLIMLLVCMLGLVATHICLYNK